MTLRSKPAVASVAFVLAVLGGARVAHAGECAVDDDCGHGFECETITSGSGGAGGTAGSGPSVGGSSSGGASAGTGGAATGGAAFAPPREVACGDGLCQTPETATSCALDCANTVCVLAVCDTTDDCADGYECAEQPLPGTGGAAGSTCGDGICTSGETQETCAEDCTATRRCAPAGGICTSDAQCADGFYCSFLGSGTGGTSASGSTGAGGFAGTLSGGASGTSGSASGGTTAGTGAGSDAALAAGTCMPREDGSGGTAGSTGTAGAFPGTGGVGTGGVGTGGTGFGGSGALGGTTSAGGSVSTGGTGGSAGSDTGGTTGGGSSGTGTGGSATGGSATGGTGTGSGGTGGTGTGSGGTAGDDDPGSAERGGCSLAKPQTRSSFAELGALLLLAASVIRRRRPS